MKLECKTRSSHGKVEFLSAFSVDHSAPVDAQKLLRHARYICQGFVFQTIITRANSTVETQNIRGEPAR